MLILDDLGSEHFHQLSCTLRRRGFATVKVTSVAGGCAAPSGRPALLRGWRNRLMYDVRTTAAEMDSCRPLQEALRAGRVVDVLASETTLATLLASVPAISAIARQGLAFATFPPEILTNKFEVNALLERSGVRIPPQLRRADATAEEAARVLGLPLLVKSYVGIGGTGVREARTVDQIERAVAELGGENGQEAFYQKFIDGEMVMYGAVCAPDGPLVERGLVVTEAQGEFGPSARVRILDDPDLLATGRRAVRALGCRGFAEIGFMRDAEGRLWHVDANLRSWGNMISLLNAGVDFTEAYTRVLLGRPYAPLASSPAVGGATEVVVLPFALYRAASEGSLLEPRFLTGQFATMCWRGPGLRYALPVMIKVGLLLAMRLAEAVRRPARRQAERPVEQRAPSN